MLLEAFVLGTMLVIGYTVHDTWARMFNTTIACLSNGRKDYLLTKFYGSTTYDLFCMNHFKD